MSNPATRWHFEPQAQAIIAELKTAEFADIGGAWLALTERADRRLVRLDVLRADAIRATGNGAGVPTTYQVLSDEFAARNAAKVLCA